jgi:predicted nucleic acid-binding protein
MGVDFVMDNSVVMAWCFEDESDDYSNRVQDSLLKATATVPSIWPLEVTNALLAGERRGRLSIGACKRFLSLLECLPIEIESESRQQIFTEIIDLARTCKLSTYDGSYLSLCIRSGLPLATRDKKLIQAANSIQVPLFEP